MARARFALQALDLIDWLDPVDSIGSLHPVERDAELLANQEKK